ncbi:helix-turn-helix transcriptional regulator [Vibrio parahaemolyticus]|nr:helix-turn-helix transcriptional regulator [Vibrio parahaemolyticus]
MSSLAERYKNARIAAGLSQGDLAKLTHCSTTVISKIERGLTNTPRNLALHAKYLGVNEVYLMYGKEIKSEPDIIEPSPQYNELNKNLLILDRKGLLHGDIFRVIEGAVSLAVRSEYRTIA